MGKLYKCRLPNKIFQQESKSNQEVSKQKNGQQATIDKKSEKK